MASAAVLWENIGHALIDLFREAETLLPGGNAAMNSVGKGMGSAEILDTNRNDGNFALSSAEVDAKEDRDCPSSTSSSSELASREVCAKVKLVLLQFKSRLIGIAADHLLLIPEELSRILSTPVECVPQKFVAPDVMETEPPARKSKSTLYHLLHIDPPSKASATSSHLPGSGHSNDVRHWIDEAQQLHRSSLPMYSTPSRDDSTENVDNSDAVGIIRLVGGHRRETIAPKGSALPLLPRAKRCHRLL